MAKSQPKTYFIFKTSKRILEVIVLDRYYILLVKKEKKSCLFLAQHQWGGSKLFCPWLFPFEWERSQGGRRSFMEQHGNQTRTYFSNMWFTKQEYKVELTMTYIFVSDWAGGTEAAKVDTRWARRMPLSG